MFYWYGGGVMRLFTALLRCRNLRRQAIFGITCTDERAVRLFMALTESVVRIWNSRNVVLKSFDFLADHSKSIPDSCVVVFLLQSAQKRHKRTCTSDWLALFLGFWCVREDLKGRSLNLSRDVASHSRNPLDRSASTEKKGRGVYHLSLIKKRCKPKVTAMLQR